MSKPLKEFIWKLPGFLRFHSLVSDHSSEKGKRVST